MLLLTVAGVLLVGAVGQCSWRRGLLVVALVGLVFGVGAAKQFGGFELEGLVTAPLFAFLIALGSWAVRRRWRNVAALLVGSLALSALLGWLWLRSDARHAGALGAPRRGGLVHCMDTGRLRHRSAAHAGIAGVGRVPNTGPLEEETPAAHRGV